jgi:hypothetical protein
MKTKIEKTELTLNDKLKIIFEKLIHYLSPTEINNQDLFYYTYIKNKRIKYTVSEAKCNFMNVNNIVSPFDDILLEVNESGITILSENMELFFIPEQLLTVYNRIKKVLKN